MNTLTIHENKPLHDHCTFGIGGPARFFIEIRSVEQARAALAFARERQLPFHILGKGSNTLFNDRGYGGVVILNKIDTMSEISPGIFQAGGGYSFSLLGVQTARQGWTGLEFASGIPASVGGAVFMNAGANGGETADRLCRVDFLHADGTLEVFPRESLQFAYRKSPFQQLPGIIVGATFALQQQPQARQRQLEIVDYRKKTQPYSDKSAGCVFRNPEGGAAGKMIELAGLKGMCEGGAKVSEKHANFIVNCGGATSEDVMRLVERVRERVREHADVTLESEVRVIPYGAPDA